MQIIENKTDNELIKSLIAEIAKSSNEIHCAKTDIIKATNRLSFAIVLLNELKTRDENK
jgi:hypothetical protein